MFVFFAVIAAALALATIIGGDIRRLSDLRIHHLELLIAAFAVRISVALLGTTHSQAASSAARPLNVIGALLLLAVAWTNRRIPGAPLFGIGLFFNLIAISTFGGRMPVLLPSSFGSSSPALPLLRSGLDPLHVLLQHPQGLWFLGDIWVIPGLFGHASLVSVGDMLMALAVAYLIVRWSQRPRPIQAVLGASPAK